MEKNMLQNNLPVNIKKIIDKTKIIVIVRGIASEKLIPLAEALYEGGIRLLEVTFDSTGKKSDLKTAEDISLLSKAFNGRMYIGAGTVLTPTQVQITQSAGGSFIISPNTDRAVIGESRICGMVSIPGAMTATEIYDAARYGADFVKIFPAVSVGPEYIKAIKAPFSGIKMLAVGGINDMNMQTYLQAGVDGFGIGANIVRQELLSENNYGRITELAKKYVEVIKNG